MQKLLRHLLLASIAALLPATAAAFSVDTISVSEPRLLDNPMPALVAVPDAAADTSLRFPTVYLLTAMAATTPTGWPNSPASVNSPTATASWW